jgi:hypothetical protein
MDTDEYVNLSDLNANYIDNHHDDQTEGEPAYQIQPEPNTNRAIIIEVGRSSKSTDILINQFNLSTKQKCIITSSIYHLKDLKELESDCKFPLIKIYVNHINGDKITLIGCMILFFHTFVHLKENKGIEDYISTKEIKTPLNGLFSISFHFGDKKIMMENMRESLGMMVMIDKMITYLTSDKIRNVVGRLVKEI